MFLEKQAVVALLRRPNQPIYTQSSLLKVIQEHAEEWSQAVAEEASGDHSIEIRSLRPSDVLNALVKAEIIERVSLGFPHRKDTRLVFGTVHLLELVQSLHAQGYFSHFTALSLNHLTEQVPKIIYFNVEQQLSGGQSELTQEGIARAFKNSPRVTTNIAEYRDTQIWKLNGRNTRQLGVIQVKHAEAGELRVTDVERTLIDATVRTAYAGGVAVVAKAFELAKPDLSVNRLASYLRKLRFTYPYHQAIGFYLERAGYNAPLVELLRQFPIEFDFYLTHAMKSTAYNERWRLYVPKGF